MCKVIAVINQKGGVGKTTTTINIGILLDRMSLSRENHWVDAENRVYIIYRIKEIMKILRVSKRKAIDLLKELEKFSLVEKKRQGVKQPNLLYVKDFMILMNQKIFFGMNVCL